MELSLLQNKLLEMLVSVHNSAENEPFYFYTYFKNDVKEKWGDGRMSKARPRGIVGKRLSLDNTIM